MDEETKGEKVVKLFIGLTGTGFNGATMSVQELLKYRGVLGLVDFFDKSSDKKLLELCDHMIKSWQDLTIDSDESAQSV